jgi:hypothetical protein
MSQWVRLWEDMPNDPKWRVIAARCGRPVGEIIAIFVHMMINAGASSHRGNIENWCDEDIAAALDFKPENVTIIREAMQGKTLDGDHLTGWEKRQPKREDSSTERVKAFRDKRGAVKRSETHYNASETQRNAPEEKRRDPDKKASDKSEAKKNPLNGDFEVFYQAYPKKVGRKEASKSFVAVVASGVNSSRVIESASKFAQAHLLAGTDKQFIPAPAVWLNQARYDDEDLPTKPNGHGRSNGTTAFVESVLEDIENDRRRREEGDSKIIPMLQRNG